MFIPIPIGRYSEETWTREWLLPCEVCNRVEPHVAYHSERRFYFLFVIPLPSIRDRYVQCGRCGGKSHITPEEQEQLEQIALGLSDLGRLQELNPEKAGRIAWEVERGWIALSELRERVKPEVDEELTVEAAERRVREGGHFPRL